MARQDSRDDSQPDNDVLSSAEIVRQSTMHVSCLTKVIGVLEQQLKRYEQELTMFRSSRQGRLKSNNHPSLLLIPSASRAGEPDNELERRSANHVRASALVDVVQSVKGAASHTLAPRLEP